MIAPALVTTNHLNQTKGAQNMNAFKVTYTDGSHYTTNANGTLESFTAYLMQDGGIMTDENPVTGKETKRQIERVQQFPQIGEIYEFTSYDGKPDTLKIAGVDQTHVYYKWTGPIALHVYPMSLDLWLLEGYKLIAK
jgi:hypothetical protein